MPMLQTKARMRNFNIDPNDVGRDANQAYDNMTNIAGVTGVVDTLAGIAKEYQLKDDERNLIEVERQLNKINMQYAHKFNKIENYADDELMLKLNQDYQAEMEALGSQVEEMPFTKDARTKARGGITSMNDKISSMQQNGYDIKQQKQDMSLLVESKSEITNMIQLEIENGIEDPAQLDSLMEQYKGNLDMLQTKGVISEAEAKADFSANYTQAVDKGMLLKALEQLQLDPNFETMTLEDQLQAHTEILEAMSPEVVMEAIKEGIKGEDYEDFIDMAQVELALEQSHKAGTQANNQLLSAVRMKQQEAQSKAMSDAETARKDQEKQTKELAWAEHNMKADMREGMSYMDARNKANRELGLMPEYMTLRDVLFDREYIETTTGISSQELTDINNKQILPQPLMGQTWINDTQNIWTNPEMDNATKYRDIQARILTASAGDPNVTEYLIKDVAGRIEGLDVGSLYVQMFPQDGQPVQQQTYKEQNESILRDGLRRDVFEQQQDLMLKYNASSGKKKKEMTDDMIGIAEQMGNKGVALTRFTGVPLYNFMSETQSQARRGFQGGVVGGIPELAERRRDFNYREVNTDKIDGVLDLHNISAEELRIPDSSNPSGYRQITQTDMVEIIDREIKNDPVAIDRLNSIMLDLYVSNTGTPMGTDIIASDITDKTWGFVQASDITKEIKKEALNKYVEYRVLELIPNGGEKGRPTPRPYDTLDTTPQLNYMMDRRR